MVRNLHRSSSQRARASHYQRQVRHDLLRGRKVKKPRPVESHTFAGMEAAVEEQAAAAAVYQGEELTAKMREPLANIDKATGDMEQNSPLFFGALHPTLF